ncbi:MAG: UvrD-helicase domain-containing protein [Clostridia bacterium]|nr:UvrD-helicase domain-containing protein [Clostridia bacterium]
MAEKKEKISLTTEQEEVIKNKSKRLVVSASAGSGKTFVVVEKLQRLICEGDVPISRLLVLTFTKAAANELKNRLFAKMLEYSKNPKVRNQLDEVALSDISTIDSFCEKLIKRNVNKLGLPQNFAILDEKSSENLKISAFSQAFDEFLTNNPQDFEEIYFAFKRNKNSLYDCMGALQNFFDSLSEGQILIEEFSKNTHNFYKQACQTLTQNMQKDFASAKHLLNDAFLEMDMIGKTMPPKHAEFAEKLEVVIFQADFSKSFFEICKSLALQSLPAISTAKIEASAKEKLSLAKGLVAFWHDMASQLQFVTPEMIKSAENGGLAQKLMGLFKVYTQKYSRLKERRFALDFADLEKYAKVLLNDDEVRENLQLKYDYIVIDEYQDTNRLQEGILKPIAEKGHFIAVGDLKQGIYAFRNANKEIMSEDIKEFTASADGEALYLRGNFRTDERILNFVNIVFEKLMTEEGVGIDYKKTSMLEGLNHFEDDGLPPVCVDVVLQEKEAKKEENLFEEVYSVQNASLANEYKYKKELIAIASRIEQVLASKIYSPKTKTFRDASQGDIALLFRGRSGLMEECLQFLREKGFSVSADIKESLVEDNEISTLVSLLKLTINSQDDIPLSSVMASHFGGFDLSELARIRETCPDGSFVDAVEFCRNNNVFAKEISNFWQKIIDFKFNIHVYGIIKAFKILFNQTDFQSYIASLDDGKTKNEKINKFFAFIRSQKLDNNPQGVVSALEKGDKDDRATFGGGNSITMTTIHATKGLEYPVVILCGAGENLGKVYNKNYIANKQFGLGTYLYEYKQNLRIASPQFLAGKLAMKRREVVDEIMLFYVALTRPQNHLYIIGSAKKEDFSFANFEEQNTYLKQIFYALGENLTQQFFEEENLKMGDVQINLLTEFEEASATEHIKNLQENTQNIDKIYNFQYKNRKNCQISYKNSVTALSHFDEEIKVGQVLFDEKENAPRDKSIEIGNSYHEALKLLDFDKVYDETSLKNQLKIVKPFMTEGYFENIDTALLLKNILLIKNVAQGNVCKEKEFIMSLHPHEVFGGEEVEEKIIVQGIVDFFAIGEKIVLVDYKYSSLKDDALINRYSSQLQLYQKALSKAFPDRPIEKYLLSLRRASLIKL